MENRWIYNLQPEIVSHKTELRMIFLIYCQTTKYDSTLLPQETVNRNRSEKYPAKIVSEIWEYVRQFFFDLLSVDINFSYSLINIEKPGNVNDRELYFLFP